MPAFGPLGEEVFNRTYRRRRGDGYETWDQMVERVVDGNLALANPFDLDALEDHELKRHISEMRLLPAGRFLWASGTTRPYLFNCHRAPWGPRLSSMHSFVFSESLKGGGVGIQYSNRDVLERVPAPAGPVNLQVWASPSHADLHELARHSVTTSRPDGEVFEVPDTREGWVASLRRVMDLSQDGGGDLIIDVSNVRPRGAPIVQFGGTASGPAPLCDLLVKVAETLNNSVGRKLTSLEHMQITHEVAATVVAGNVRRSALMSIKHWADEDILDFVHCKQDNPESFWATNISVQIDDDFFADLGTPGGLASTVLEAVVEGMLTNGEPGFYNSSLASVGERGDVSCTNPCGEQPLEEAEACCLGHINLAHYGDDLEGAKHAARLMTRFLLRATCADIEDPLQEMVVRHNRRIGVGLLGLVEFAASMGLPYSEIRHSDKIRHFLTELAEAVDDEAWKYSRQLGIPTPVKTRTIAPTGTVAKLCGHSEGAAPLYARHWIQRIRYSNDDPLLQDEIAKGRHTEPCIYTENTTVVATPTRASILDEYPAELIESVDELDLDDLLGTQAFFQEVWSDNAVSFTCNTNPDLSSLELEQALIQYLPQLKGTTIFPDLSRPQSPFERIPDGVYEIVGDVLGGYDQVGQAIEDCASGACPVR
jgi:ribonucleoside-triphosphate reductase